MKKRTYEILELAKPGDVPSRIADLFIIALISVNVIAVVLETVVSLEERYHRIFFLFEFFSVIVFTIEYALRIWTCNLNQEFRSPIVGRIRFGLTPLALVDLIAILPFYLPMIFAVDLRFVRILRLLRFLRILKIGRYSESMKTLGNVLRAKREDLLVTVFVVLTLLVLASSIMYFVESEAQPEAFSSIPAAMWWGVATLTTVGYGDVYPITPLGKFLGTIIALLGVGMFAMPAGILASGFADEMQRRRKKRAKRCPHCGKEIEAL